MELFSPALAPFMAALVMLALILALEVGGLLFGATVSGMIDSALPDLDFDGADADGLGAGAGFVEQALSWLYVGKVPALIVLASFLAGFGLSGFVLQSAAHGVFGAALPVWVAAPLAFLAALPATRFLAIAFSRVMPKEESDAVSRDSFIGRIALVLRGEARRGAPAEAKLADATGATHYILVEPADDVAAFAQGAEVLLVEKRGAVFRAVANDNPALAGQTGGV